MPRFPTLMLLVFALTLFTSATLLFLVEPMIGKMILPLLGGTPAVWNTAMVFFQAVLLLGYLYAHLSTTWLGARKQAVLHVMLLAVPFVALPLFVDRSLVKGDENPVLLVLMLLSMTVGVPMFVVSASAPLLQKWFASTSHPAAKDPYFLYGASNLGSMLALIAYPTVVEPYLRLRQQSVDWTVGYSVLAALTALSAVFLWFSPRNVETVEKSAAPADDNALDHTLGGAVSWLRVLRWVALAFVPSSLMLGTTTYITTDIAAIAFLWVAPLALYLLSFILVFSRLPAWLHKGMVLLMPLLILALLFFMQSELTTTKYWMACRLGMHLAALFVISMVCHGELARDRPAPRYLTGYFLWMSVGGVLGGLFNGLLAPVIFNGIVEYQLAMVLACYLAPTWGTMSEGSWGRGVDAVLAGLFATIGLMLVFMRLHFHEIDFEPVKDGPWIWQSAALLLVVVLGVAAALRARTEPIDHWMDLAMPLCLGLLLLGLIWGLPLDMVKSRIDKLAGLIHVPPLRFLLILTYGVPVVLCYTFVERPLRFALGVGVLLLVGAFTDNLVVNVQHQERSFFGVLMIKHRAFAYDNELFAFRDLYHGTTLHGTQTLDDDDKRRDEPLTYYHHSGPIGQVMLEYNRPDAGSGRLPNLAVVGLGTGTMATYAHAGQHLTFYDIDPVVRRLSFDEDDPYFSFVADARLRGAQMDLIMGDARLTMEKRKLEESEKYDIMVLDAFSSDAIPIHLLTVEALKLYLSKLNEDGLLCFHISNRHLDLRPVVYNLAKECRLAAVYQSDDYEGDAGPNQTPHSSAYFGKSASSWVVLARRSEHLNRLRDLNDWEDWRHDTRAELQSLSLLPDGGMGLAAHAALLHNLLGEEVCKRPSQWQELEPDERWPKIDKVGVWTDDYSNLLGVFLW